MLRYFNRAAFAGIFLFSMLVGCSAQSSVIPIHRQVDLCPQAVGRVGAQRGGAQVVSAICITPSPERSPSPAPSPTATPTPAPTVYVDIRQYMAAAIATASGSGNMLCDPLEDNANPNPSCLTSFYDGDQNGETEIANANGIIDYIGITSEQFNPFGEGPLQYIGVIRNYPADGTSTSASEPLRCFTTAQSPTTQCTAPPSGHVLEGVPYIIQHLPIVSWSSVQATEYDPSNPQSLDDYATRAVPGALISTIAASDGTAPANYWNYAVNYFGTNCSQTHQFNTYSQVRVVYVAAIPFGGDIGTQDAILIDGLSFGNNPTVLERYYYVKGYGRVRETVSYAYNGSSTYGPPAAGANLAPAESIDRNSVRVLNTSWIQFNKGGWCPQGSAVPIF